MHAPLTLLAMVLPWARLHSKERPTVTPAERDNLRSRLEAAVRGLGAVRLNANQLTIGELSASFIKHSACDYAARRGTTEIQNFQDATRELLLLYAHLPAIEFDVLHLKTVRALMVHSGIARSTINSQRIRRIRTIFRWATEHHGLAPHIITRLESVRHLRPNTEVAGVRVREARKPLPPSPETIAAVLLDSKCPRVNRDMLKFQKLTSARPGEVCCCRGDAIDQSVPTGKPWIWKPQSHKNAWREKSRVIFIGPAAQLVILPYLQDGFLFTTRCRGRLGGRAFRVDHYHQMIKESCERIRVARFSPQMIRRVALTEADEATDIETAMELASHSDLRTTEIYLQRGGRRAMRYAQERG